MERFVGEIQKEMNDHLVLAPLPIQRQVFHISSYDKIEGLLSLPLETSEGSMVYDSINTTLNLLIENCYVYTKLHCSSEKIINKYMHIHTVHRSSGRGHWEALRAFLELTL